MCATHDNIFRMVSLNLFFAVWTNLINSNIFYNHIFIYYRNNYKFNIYNFFLYQNENNTIFLKNSKGSKNINFLIKIIYNILCIIKKYIKF